MRQEARVASIESATSRREEVCNALGVPYADAQWDDWRWQSQTGNRSLPQNLRKLRSGIAASSPVTISATSFRLTWHGSRRY